MTMKELIRETNAKIRALKQPICDALNFSILDNQGKVKLCDWMGDEINIVNAARSSYHKEITAMREKDWALLKRLWENNPKHSLPFEHVVFTIEIEVPIFVERQFRKHRTIKKTWEEFVSKSEWSRRFTSEGVEIYKRKVYHYQHKDNKQRSGESVSSEIHQEAELRDKETRDKILETYTWKISKGIATQEARDLLPIATMTYIRFTGNLWNLLDFLRLRDHPDAQDEIVEVAVKVGEIIGSFFDFYQETL